MSTTLAKGALLSIDALRRNLVNEARKKIFGTVISVDNTRTGRKQLRAALKGPGAAGHYPFLYHHGFDKLYEDEAALRRLTKLEALRKRGKGPPKKGQGRRSSKSKKK